MGEWTRVLRAAILLTLLCGVVLALPGASPAASPFPAFYEIADGQGLSSTVDVDFDFEGLETGGGSERLTVTIPTEYGVALAHAPGKNIGTAYVSTVPIGGGAETAFTGLLFAAAGDVDVSTCDPGPHAAVWVLRVRATAGGTLEVPVAIDRSTSGYELVACFDAEHALGREVSQLEFQPENSFATPAHAGRYLFDATVTPFGPDGSVNTSAAYEMRAYEVLPQVLTAKVSYDARTRLFTASGKYTSEGKPTAGKHIEIDVGTTPRSFAKVGDVVTTAGGAYLFHKRLSGAPRYAYSQLEANSYEVCSGASPAPAGCASYSIGGTASAAIAVRTGR